MKAKALMDATPAAIIMAEQIRRANSRRDYINAGAFGERFMQSRGWKLNPLACPGKFNTEILATEFTLNSFVVDIFGNIRATGKWEYKTGSCRICKEHGGPVGPCSICQECERKFD